MNLVTCVGGPRAGKRVEIADSERELVFTDAILVPQDGLVAPKTAVALKRTVYTVRWWQGHDRDGTPTQRCVLASADWTDIQVMDELLDWYRRAP